VNLNWKYLSNIIVDKDTSETIHPNLFIPCSLVGKTVLYITVPVTTKHVWNVYLLTWEFISDTGIW